MNNHTSRYQHDDNRSLPIPKLTPPAHLSSFQPSITNMISRLFTRWPVTTIAPSHIAPHDNIIAIKILHPKDGPQYLYPWSPLGALQALLEDYEAEHE